jgi:hypothetical protein
MDTMGSIQGIVPTCFGTKGRLCQIPLPHTGTEFDLDENRYMGIEPGLEFLKVIKLGRACL